MSEQRYWTAVDRSIWDHPLWEGQRLSQREAFQWLFSNASFKPRRVRVGNHMVPLNRGQLVGARAYLAKTWGWGEQEVRTYLSVLEREGMITKNQHSNQKITIISVCNFDKYQSVSHKANQPTNQDLTNTQPRPNQSQNTDTRLHEEEKRELERVRASSQILPANALDINPLTKQINHGVELQADGRVTLHNGIRDEWLAKFGDDHEALDDALIQASGYVQPHSRKALKTQVESQLARIARERRDRDRRYETAAAQRPTKSNTGSFADQRRARTRSAIEAVYEMGLAAGEYEDIRS